MAEEYGTLRIKAERLGTVVDVRSFLTDIESAYNSIYVFYFLVDSLINDRNRQRDFFEERLSGLTSIGQEKISPLINFTSICYGGSTAMGFIQLYQT